MKWGKIKGFTTTMLIFDALLNDCFHVEIFEDERFNFSSTLALLLLAGIHVLLHAIDNKKFLHHRCYFVQSTPYINTADIYGI